MLRARGNLTHRRSSVGDLSMRTGKNAFELRRWMHLSACLEKIPSRSVCSECGGVLSCMKLSPLHGFQINVAAEEGGDGGNRRTDVADVGAGPPRPGLPAAEVPLPMPTLKMPE